MSEDCLSQNNIDCSMRNQFLCQLFHAIFISEIYRSQPIPSGERKKKLIEQKENIAKPILVDGCGGGGV